MTKLHKQKEVYSKINEAYRNTDNIVIITHVNPDGDAIGSSLGLYHFLKKLNKNVNVVVPNDFPDFLKWMPSNDEVVRFNTDTDRAVKLIEESNLIFFLDFNDIDRVPKVCDYIKKSNATKIMIDHHPNPSDFVDIMLSEIEVSSTAELVCDYILNSKESNLLDKTISECLFVGILTDTISFTVNAHRPKTFLIASALIEKGVERDEVHDKVFNNFSEPRMKLLGHVLNNQMNVMPGYKAAYMYLTKEDQKKYDFVMGDSEGFVNYPLSIKGIIFSAFFMEKKDYIKISFRSKGKNKINDIAVKYFNGGGHRNAAGGESYESLDDTIAKFVKILPELLKSNNIHV